MGHNRCVRLRTDRLTETYQIGFQVPSAWNRFGGFGSYLDRSKLRLYKALRFEERQRRGTQGFFFVTLFCLFILKKKQKNLLNYVDYFGKESPDLMFFCRPARTSDVVVESPFTKSF